MRKFTKGTLADVFFSEAKTVPVSTPCGVLDLPVDGTPVRTGPRAKTALRRRYGHAAGNVTEEDVIRRLQKRDYTRKFAEALVTRYRRILTDHPNATSNEIADRIGTASDCDAGIHTNQCPHGSR